MSLCPKCGSQVDDGVKYCGACGMSMGPAPAIPPASPTQGIRSGPAGPAGQSGLAPNIAAMLTYVPLCFVGLVCAILFGFVLEPYKNDRFVRFHAWQSLAAHALCFVVSLGWFILTFLLTAIAHFLGIITFPLSILVGLALMGLMVLLMIKAYGNERFKLPVIGDWAEKQTSG